MPSIVQAALLGVVQGLTEFLPVSSTAHLLIGGRLLGYQDPGGVFTVMIQLGSILAVMWLYRAKLIAVITGLPTNPATRRFAAMLAIAVVPALVAGALLSKYVKSVLYNSFNVIAAAFVLGGIVMLVVERFRPAPTVTDADRTPLPRAFGIGVCQTLALVPGVSRSGATIVGGMLAGLDPPPPRNSRSSWRCRRWRPRSRTICSRCGVTSPRHGRSTSRSASSRRSSRRRSW